MSQPTVPTVRGLVAPFLERFDCPHLLRLDFGGFGVDVRVNDERLAAWLADYFRDFHRAPGPAHCEVLAVECDPQTLPVTYSVKEPEPGKTKIKEEWADLVDGRVVRKRLTGMLFLFGQGCNLALGPCLDNPNQVVNFINNRFIEHKLNQGCLLGHAAAVAWDGEGLALAGFSGMGKSTLALHMMNLGLDFVSNDRVMLGRDSGGLTMYGVAKMPRVNPGTVLHNTSLAGVMPDADRAAFKDLPIEELWSLEHKYDAFIDECFGPGRFQLEARMKGLAILNWKRGGGELKVARVDIAQRRDLLPAFMKSTGLFYDTGADMPIPDFSEDAYVEALGGCTVLEVTGGADFETAARELTKFLKG
ncbi:HprK-related kinase B [Fundidesulfovibrio terrae]|uniref:HprK-related kinase B n=1 Tax=Fundidesulfovibrio terrae TaxID=2922866 RepID=UPI001FAFC246|nr:HprK-related kinase B [Fundidesulfovibrio terrae]